MQRKSFVEIEATINKIGDVVNIETQSGKPFSRRSIECTFGSEEYPSEVAIEFAGKSVDLPLQLSIGKTYVFKCNMRGYRTKTGNLVTATPNCFAVDELGTKKAAPATAAAAVAEEEGEDLPF